MPRKYNLSDVLEVWDEIPEDDQVTDESSSDDDDDYTPDEPCSGIDALAKDQIQDDDEIDSCGTQDCSNATTTATRMPKKKSGGKRASSTQKKDKLVEQVQLIEHFMVINDHPYPLSADQVKLLQKEISSKLKEDLSVAQVKRLVEIARREWKRVEKPSEDDLFHFPEGPKMEYFSDCQTPADVFFQFLDNETVDNIVFQTNLYINQMERRVPPITRNELYGFIGINMVMSYHKLPSWTDYWSNDSYMSVPFVSSVMTRDRFGQTLSSLHVNDNATIPDGNQDKLYKLRHLLTQ